MREISRELDDIAPTRAYGFQCSFDIGESQHTLRVEIIGDLAITVDGVPATSFAVNVDLGALVARAAYKAAFDA